MDEITQLKKWELRTLVALDAHYDTARALRRVHFWIGMPAVVLSTVVGTSTFTALSEDPGDMLFIVRLGDV